MKRDPFDIPNEGTLHQKVGLSSGGEGGYYVDGDGYHGQDHEDSIVDYNIPPAGQPGLWCQRIPTSVDTLEWDGGEKFYNYVEWLQYLVAHFFNRWGYTLSGTVTWRGEDRSDIGTIVVEGQNEIKVVRGELVSETDISATSVTVEDGPAEQDQDIGEDLKSIIKKKVNRLEEIASSIKQNDNEIEYLKYENDDLMEEEESLRVELETIYSRLKDLFE